MNSLDLKTVRKVWSKCWLSPSSLSDDSLLLSLLLARLCPSPDIPSFPRGIVDPDISTESVTPSDPHAFFPLVSHEALYAEALKGIEISDKAVAEMNAGRGQGASFVTRTFSPLSFVAADPSEAHVAFGRNFFETSSLRFRQSPREIVPLPDKSCDVLLNLFSHSVPTKTLTSEIARVLRKDGKFCLAHFFRPSDLLATRELFQQEGMEQVHSRDLSQGILRALQSWESWESETEGWKIFRQWTQWERQRMEHLQLPFTVLHFVKR